LPEASVKASSLISVASTRRSGRDFFKASASTDQIDRIMLSGGASRVDGFHQMVQERFNAPVEEFDPFRAVTWDEKKLGDASTMAATAAVAVGLALRKASDR